MCVHVYLHVDLLVEALGAVGADVGPVVAVGPHVRMQIRRSVERLATLVADVRLHLKSAHFIYIFNNSSSVPKRTK